MKRGKKRAAIAIPLIALFFIVVAYLKEDPYTAKLISMFVIFVLAVCTPLGLWLSNIYLDAPEMRGKMCQNAIKYLEKKERKK